MNAPGDPVDSGSASAPDPDHDIPPPPPDPRNKPRLRQGEELFRALFEQAGDYVFVLDPAPPGGPVILDANQAACRMHGCTREDLVGRPISDLDDEVDSVGGADLISRILIGEPVVFEAVHRRKDGSCFPVEISARRVDFAGKPPLILSVERDLTGYRRAGEALRESEALLRIAGRTSRFGGWSVNLADGEVVWSEEVGLIHEKRPGYSPSVEEGIRFYAPEWRERIAAVFAACAEQGTPYDEEMEILTARGRRVWVRTTGEAVRDGAGTIVRVQGSFQDITRHKQVEEALRASEERMTSAFEYAAIGMAFVSPDGRWMKVNPAVPRLLGYTEEELLAKTFQDITHPDDLEADLDQVRRMLAGEIATYQMEKRYFHKTGRIVWVLLSVSLVRDPQGKPLHFISQIQDITERKRAEEEREATIRLLQLLNAGSGTHDLMRSLLAFFQELTGCEAAAVRLREGEDYPYIETRGFPPEFVQAESHLCVRDLEGQMQRDEIGNPVLECMCGNILRGRFDPAKPFFTPCGSFWSNCTSALLASTTEADRQSRTRNRCNSEGYESVALIPLRKDGAVIGLLQLNDRRRGRFSPESIALMEHLADSITVALVRQKAEEALRESEARLAESNQILAGVLEHTSMMAVYLDPQFNFIWANRAYAASCRREAGFFRGKNHFDLYPGEENRAIFQRVVDTGEPFSISEKPFVFPDQPERGTTFWDWSLVPIKENEGKVTGLVFTLAEVTNRVQAEAAHLDLERKLHEARKAESLGRMAGAIAHHFNNQLGVVLGNLELAMIDLPPGSAPGTAVAEAMKAAGRAAEVSGGMLTYLGQTPARRAPLDLAAACRESLPALRAELPETADLAANLPAPGPVISANDHQIRQVLANLAANAREALGAGPGTVRLTVSAAAAEDIPALFRFPADWEPNDRLYACLEVADTGCGIPQEDIEKIFDPFFSTKFTGRGLGLPVVQGIVGAHGGGITVESEAGRGSVFRVFFPLAAEPPRPAGKPPLPRTVEWSGTVLLVEDEPSVRAIAKTMLARLGFAVIEAADGAEAVDLFSRNPDAVRCVLCDLTMPRMDGWETIAALRRLAPGIPVVLASGYDQAQVLADVHPELPQAFLGKPYQSAALREAIQKALCG